MPVFALMVKLTNKIMVFAACLLAGSFQISEVTGGPGDTYHRPVPENINNPVINEPRQNQRTLFQDTIGRTYTWLAGGIKKIINKASAYTASICNEISEATAESELTTNVETQAVVPITDTETQTIALQPHIQISAAINEFHIQKEPKPFFQRMITEKVKALTQLNKIYERNTCNTHAKRADKDNADASELKKMHNAMDALEKDVADRISRDATRDDLPKNYKELGLDQKKIRIIDFNSTLDGMVEDLGKDCIDKYKNLQKMKNFNELLKKLEVFFYKQFILIQKYGDRSGLLYSVDQTLTQSDPDRGIYATDTDRLNAYKKIGVEFLMREFSKLKNNSTAREILTLFLAVNEIILKKDPNFKIKIQFFNEFFTPMYGKPGDYKGNLLGEHVGCRKYTGMPCQLSLCLRDMEAHEVNPGRNSIYLAPTPNNTVTRAKVQCETNSRFTIIHELGHFIFLGLGQVCSVLKRRPSKIFACKCKILDDLFAINQSINDDNIAKFKHAIKTHATEGVCKNLAGLKDCFTENVTNSEYIDDIFQEVEDLLAPCTVVRNLVFDNLFTDQIELLQVLGIYTNGDKLYFNKINDFCVNIQEGIPFRLYYRTDYLRIDASINQPGADAIYSVTKRMYASDLRMPDNGINALFSIYREDQAEYYRKYTATQQALQKQNAQSTTSQVTPPYPGYTPLLTEQQYRQIFKNLYH